MPNNESEIVIDLPKPQPRQVEFLQAREKYVAYGGARGGGKTWVVRLKAHILCLKYPGFKALILRRTYPELEDNHITPLRELSRGVATYNESKKALTYLNGSTIRFGYAASAGDLLRYQGQEYDVIFIDEATQFKEEAFTKLKACVRGVNNYPKRIYLTCNPGGIGHAWVKRLFVDRNFNEREDSYEYRFIRARVQDNVALMNADPDYLKNLESLPDGLREAWLEGKWDITAGSYFAEFDRDVNVTDPIELKDYWKYYCAIDYGLDALAAVVVAIDELGNEYVIRELQESGLIVSQAAERLHALVEGININEWYAPPDLWSRQKDSGKSIIELFGESGIHFLKANNDRVAGWLNLKERIKALPSPDGESKQSRLRIFSSCKLLIEYLPMLQISLKNPSDCDTEPHEITHICDALRYFCISRQTLPIRKEEESYIDKYKKMAIGISRCSRGKRF